MIYIFLADGFEELEAVAPIDCLRRAGFDVKSVGVGAKDNPHGAVTSAHGIKLIPDTYIENLSDWSNAEMIILPGGMPGTKNLEKSEAVRKVISFCAENDIYIAAICAAPSILGRMGLLRDHCAVCYPGFEEYLFCEETSDESVCISGKFITAKSAGCSLEFGLALVNLLSPEGKSDEISQAMLRR